MSDLNLNIRFPNQIVTDVVASTYDQITNVYEPIQGPQGPSGLQGPSGAQGLNAIINEITGSLLNITGRNGIIISSDQSINTIYISGNSGYFQSAVNSLTTNLNNTGANLNTSINSLSGLFTGYTGTLDATFASDIQLANTGATLVNAIDSLSGTLTGNYLTTNVASSTYATISNLNSTGNTLNSSISSLSGTLTSDYATIINLASTGSNLQNQINSLDNVYATDASVTAVANNLASTGSTLETKIGSLSGTLTSDYATITNLASTGSTLNNNINSLSGTLTSNYATITNLASTGSTLVSSINSLNSAFTGFTGNLDATYATDSQLTSTGSTLVSSINSLSGYINSTSSNIIFTTGNQIKSGRLIIGNDAGSIVDPNSEYTLSLQTNSPRTWLEILNNSGANKGVFFGIEGNDFEQYNWQAGDIKFFTSENVSDGFARLTIKNDGKVGIGTSSPSEKLEVVGNILANNLVYNTGNQIISGNKTFDLAPIVSGNPLITGNLSLYATTINLATTGSTLDIKINNLSGYVNSQDVSISNNLISTGNTLQNNINSLSGSSVLLYGNQSVGGVKTFRDNVYINNLFVTGTETIVSTNNFNVQSPYVLLNLTGGAVDGGIFFVTGSGLTGVNDTGPIIGFDHVNKFKFGISTRNSDLSTLPDIASVQDIQAYSGVADGKFSTITNLASTGNTLEQKISSLSGTLTSTYATITNLASTGSTLTTNLASTGSTLNSSINSLSGTLTSNYATIINLASTGSTLNSNINSLSGTLTSTYATITNLANTGSTLVNSINSLSGTLTSTYATITNLASTGSTLNTKIDNLSGHINSTNSNIVFTTGNQIISGTKTFNSGVVINVQPTGTNPALNITGTWNNASQLYTGISLNITDTNSNTNSKFINFNNNGIDRLSIQKDGSILLNLGNFVDIIDMTPASAPDSFIRYDGSRAMSFSDNFSTHGSAVGKSFRIASDCPFGFSSDTTPSQTGPDVILRRDTVGILAQRNGTNPQQFRIYNATGTNSGEFGLFGWQNNQLVIGSQAINSGILRDLTLTGNNININASGVFNIFDNTNIVGNLNVTGNTAFTARPTINGTGVLLSGEAAQVDLTSTVRTTGNQIVSGIKDFQSIPEVSGKDIYYQKDVFYFTGNNFTPNNNLARTFEYILTGAAGASATLNAPINMGDGENIIIKIKQSPSGSNNMEFNAAYKFPGSVVPSLTLTASKADIYTVLKVGTGFYSTYVKDFID
jgi:conjugal transfer/entry exclusion protein